MVSVHDDNPGIRVKNGNYNQVLQDISNAGKFQEKSEASAQISDTNTVLTELVCIQGNIQDDTKHANAYRTKTLANSVPSPPSLCLRASSRSCLCVGMGSVRRTALAALFFKPDHDTNCLT